MSEGYLQRAGLRVDQLVGYLFAIEETRFGIELGAELSQRFLFFQR
jgi:hypothetical protein